MDERWDITPPPAPDRRSCITSAPTASSSPRRCSCPWRNPPRSSSTDMDLNDEEQDTNPPAQAIPMPNGEPLLSAVAREDLLLDFGHQLRNELNAIVSAASMLSATATT